MYAQNETNYKPDLAIPPGETLLEILEDIGMSQVELSTRLGMAEQTVNGIIKGKKSITPDTSIKLERALNISAKFWNNLEKKYKEDYARIAAEQKLENEIALATKYEEAYSVLVKNQFIEKATSWKEKTLNLLKFFGVDSLQYVHQTEAVAFRSGKSNTINKYSLAAWLRCGEIEVRDVNMPSFNKEKMKTKLNSIRELTLHPDAFSEKLKEIAADSGVAIVYTPYFRNTHINGAFRWINNKPLVQLNIRGAFSDIFWFTVFHEIGHVLIHGKKEVSLDFSFDSKETKEIEADKFASNTLISEKEYNDFCSKNVFTHNSIKEFANKIGVDKGIVAGRLAYDKKIKWNATNHLRTRLTFAI